MKVPSDNPSTNDQPTPWQQLEPGALKQAAHRHRASVRQREWIKGGVAVAGIVLSLLWILTPRADVGVREYHYGGISCSEVGANAYSYLDKKLDESTREKIEEHLKLCGQCRMYLQRIEAKPSNGIHALNDNRLPRSHQRNAMFVNSRSISLAFGLRNR